MRKILFRGKRLDNGEWAEGRLLPKCAGYTMIVHPSSFIGVDEFDTLYMGNWHDVNDSTVCQYTGLKDKNGNAVYEGDIILDHFDNSIAGVVRYGEYRNPFNDDMHGGHCGFYVDWGDKKDKFRADLGYWIKVSEIAGNIFDNPELIRLAEKDSGQEASQPGLMPATLRFSGGGG